MRTAVQSDRQIVTDILSASFEANKSVNDIIKQDAHRVKRIQALMAYSFDMCMLHGNVFISDDGNACALVLYPHKKSFSLHSVLLDIRLLFQSIGFANIRKTLSREALIKKQHPATPFTYIWFLGVTPALQGKGLGSKLLNDIFLQNERRQMPVYLETSTVNNLPFYQKHGFIVYHEEQLTYPLFFLKKSVAIIS